MGPETSAPTTEGAPTVSAKPRRDAATFLLISAAATLRRARIEEAQETQLHVQAWRLRQLVPQAVA